MVSIVGVVKNENVCFYAYKYKRKSKYIIRIKISNHPQSNDSEWNLLLSIHVTIMGLMESYILSAKEKM